MIDWIPVQSSRVASVAYDEATETIYVEFRDGARWWYSECPPHIWEEFNAPATSMGRYIADVLDGHPKGPMG